MLNVLWISKIVRIYIQPLVTITGILLNLLCFYVIRKSRHLSITNLYVAYLSLINCGVLVIGGLNHWLHLFNIQFSLILSSNIFCKMFTFLFYTFSYCSVFILIIMTIERVRLALNYTKINRKSKTRCLKLFILSIFCSILLNSHFLVSYHIESMLIYFQNKTILEKSCIDTRWNYFYENIWIYLDAMIYSIFPFIALNILNGIILSLLKNNKIKRFTTKTRQQIDHSRLSNYKGKKIKIKTNNQKISLILISINLSYLIFSMPIVLLQIIYFIINKNLEINRKLQLYIDMAKSIAELLQYFNHSTNFILYCIHDKIFRNRVFNFLNRVVNFIKPIVI